MPCRDEIAAQQRIGTTTAIILAVVQARCKLYSLSYLVVGSIGGRASCYIPLPVNCYHGYGVMAFPADPPGCPTLVSSSWHHGTICSFQWLFACKISQEAVWDVTGGHPLIETGLGI